MHNMTELLKETANSTYTENGAVTHETSGSDCLDLFATIGGMRKADESEIILRFVRAYTENPDHAMKLLFYARDVRGGLGERRVFRLILRWLAENQPMSVIQNIRLIPEYGRYDDLLVLMGTVCEAKAVELIRKQLDEDLAALAEDGTVSLLAKWLPSVNTSNAQAVRMGRRLAGLLRMSEAAYRKTLSKLRAQIRIIENNLRTKQYDFDYEKQPSKALFKYRAAFMRNDEKRYTDFLNRVSKGEASMHTGTLMPYELVEAALQKLDQNSMTPSEAMSLNTTWEHLEDYGGSENMLAVVDTSGSMYWHQSPSPAGVALSLGMYFAERNKGAFANHFITFSEKPRLLEIKGSTFTEKLRYLTTFNEVADTNLEAVFLLVLKTAVRYQVPQSELPSKLVIISDMEFNHCVMNGNQTNFENARQLFAQHGYRLPDVVFWNVASRNRQQPVTKNEQGAALVSGCTPRLFAMIAGGTASPMQLMLEILESERYKAITA